MKIGIQTIAWEDHPSAGSLNKLLPEMTREIREAGYDGIELFQPAVGKTHMHFLQEQLEKNSLELVGVSAGSFEDRLNFVRAYRPFAGPKQTPYIYTDEWPDDLARQAVSEGFRIAVHPHMFKPIQTVAEALPHLAEFGNDPAKVGLLPDSAHQQIAGEPFLDVLEKHYDKLTAIHLKDWTPEYGRSYQFYAQGFVALGEGDVPLTKIIEYLRSRKYSGWAIVEVDVMENPFDIARKCRDWLRTQGV